VESPWLSVIIPSHNDERWLGGALQSLVDQHDPGIEVIVIDASATEASLKIVSDFSCRLNIWSQRRLDLLSWPEKANFAVEQAKADQICVLHPDDLWLPNRCAKLREWLAIQPDSVMHLHPCYFIDGSGRRLALWRCPLPSGRFPVPAPILFERLLVQNFIAVPAPTIRRDAFLRVGGLDSSLWHTADWDLYFKVASVGSVYYHSCPLACYRIHKNSLGMRGIHDSEDFRRQHEIVIDRHVGKLFQTSKNETFRIARASVDVNVALAAAIGGRFGQIPKALISVLTLGPRGIGRYFLYSRVLERALPRLRALVTGRF
jgi:glycosyltransferase involved in cell wall biosynthesis